MTYIIYIIWQSIFYPNPLQDSSRKAAHSSTIGNDAEVNELNQGKCLPEAILCKTKCGYDILAKEIAEYINSYSNDICSKTHMCMKVSNVWKWDSHRMIYEFSSTWDM